MRTYTQKIRFYISLSKTFLYILHYTYQQQTNIVTNHLSTNKQNLLITYYHTDIHNITDTYIIRNNTLSTGFQHYQPIIIYKLSTGMNNNYHIKYPRLFNRSITFLLFFFSTNII